MIGLKESNLFDLTASIIYFNSVLENFEQILNDLNQKISANDNFPVNYCPKLYKQCKSLLNEINEIKKLNDKFIKLINEYLKKYT